MLNIISIKLYLLNTQQMQIFVDGFGLVCSVTTKCSETWATYDFCRLYSWLSKIEQANAYAIY